MRIIIVLVFAIAATLNCFSQQTADISGRLTIDGQPVANRSIRLVSANSTYDTNTDSSGNYRFKNVPDGRYLFIYQGKQRSVTVASGRISEANLADVVTVSSNELQNVEQVSKSVDITSGQEMRDRADFSLIESLRTVAGLRVQQSGGFGRVATIKTRGLRNQDTAVLIDGVRFRDPTAITGDASPFLSDITLTSVDRIEVLRGSGSSLYGTNAIGGVIDLETASARPGTHGQLALAAGGLGLQRYRGVLSHGTKDGNFGINIAAARTFYTKGVDGNDAAHNTNFQTKIDARPGKRTSFLGSVLYSRADVRLNVGPDTLGGLPGTNAAIIDARPGLNFLADSDDPDAIQRSHFFSGQLSATQILRPSAILSGYYHGLSTLRQNDDGPLGPGFQSTSTSIFSGEIHTGHVQIAWAPSRRNTLTSGYEFEVEKYRNEGRTPSGRGNFFTNAGQHSSTSFVQDLLSLDRDRLQLAGGFRAQQFRLDPATFSLANAPYSSLTLSAPPAAYTFDGSVAYYLRESGTKLRAHVGNGYRVPSLFERFGTFFSTFGSASFVALGDPTLKPERSTAFDAGVEQNAANDRVRLSATYFYTRLTDVIGFGNVVPSVGATTHPFGGYLNQKGGVSRGAEFSGRVRPRASTELFASYTYTNSDQRTPQVTGTSILSTLGVPTNQFTLVANQRFGSRAWINFDFVATSSYLAPIFSNSTFSTYVYRFRGNRRGDLTAGYTFRLKGEKQTVRLFGTIENVFDQEYFENGFRTTKATARLGLSYGF